MLINQQGRRLLFCIFTQNEMLHSRYPAVKKRPQKSDLWGGLSMRPFAPRSTVSFKQAVLFQNIAHVRSIGLQKLFGGAFSLFFRAQNAACLPQFEKRSPAGKILGDCHLCPIRRVRCGQNDFIILAEKPAGRSRIDDRKKPLCCGQQYVFFD